MVDFTTISPHINVKFSPTAKRLALRLDTQSRRVNLVIPQKASIRKAYKFAESHQDWINDKIDSLPAPVPFTDGTILPLMGKKIVLRIYKDGSKTTSFNLTETELHIHTNRYDISPRILRYMKNLAVAELQKIAQSKATQIGKPITKFTVRDMRSRWGSCSLDGKMTLAWRLIFAPMEAIDYVISHESAHLIHGDHGREFWQLCEKLCLNYKIGKEWMKENGHGLSRFGESPQHTQ